MASVGYRNSKLTLSSITFTLQHSSLFQSQLLFPCGRTLIISLRNRSNSFILNEAKFFIYCFGNSQHSRYFTTVCLLSVAIANLKNDCLRSRKRAQPFLRKKIVSLWLAFEKLFFLLLKTFFKIL